MRIRVSVPYAEPYESDLFDFAVQNEIAPDDLAEIVGTLTNGLEYIGGGGASPFYTLSKINPALVRH